MNGNNNLNSIRSVFLCRNSFNEECCVKRIEYLQDLDKSSDNTKKQISQHVNALSANQLKHRQMVSREIYMLLHLDHPRIIRCTDFFADKTGVHIVMEYCNNGTLQQLIRSRYVANKSYFSVEVRQTEIFIL